MQADTPPGDQDPQSVTPEYDADQHECVHVTHDEQPLLADLFDMMSSTMAGSLVPAGDSAATPSSPTGFVRLKLIRLELPDELKPAEGVDAQVAVNVKERIDVNGECGCL